VAAAPPATPAQAAVLEAWREVLGRDDVGVRDGFFDAGGHSLLLMELQARLEVRLGRGIPITLLLQHPTVEEFCLRVLGDGPPPPEANAAAEAEETGRGMARLRRLRERAAAAGGGERDG
jgi:hypothetical protein